MSLKPSILHIIDSLNLTIESIEKNKFNKQQPVITYSDNDKPTFVCLPVIEILLLRFKSFVLSRMS